jgi:NAD(P)-dependent dehydrogenase (short-subunit alcohol dehydrogenase family)
VLADKVVVITGAARGIGAAIAERFASEGAAVVVSDIDLARAREVVRGITDRGGRAEAVRADAGSAPDVAALVAATNSAFGPVDVFCSNAGVAGGEGLDTTSRQWARAWTVNVMAHVHVAREVVPGMLERGGGALVITASAAGLLNIPGDPAYAATKSAAIAFADWLRLTYGARGLQVSALCPLGVRTDMLLGGLAAGHATARAVAAHDEVLEASDVADAVVRGLRDGDALILPHRAVAQAYAEKAADPARWLQRWEEALTA